MNTIKKIRTRTISLVLICLLFASCSSDITKPTLDNIVIYPKPPAKTRLQYLTSFSSSVDVTGQQSEFMEFVAGEEEEYSILKPYGITIYQGKIYICDTIIGAIIILDIVDESYELFQPKGFGQLKKPINCIKDNKGNLYVVDAKRAQVLVFDKEDNFVKAFGEKNLQKPTDVFIDESSIYVADLKGGDVKVFSKNDYSFIRSLPNEDLSDNDRIYQPTNIYVKKNRLYVSDFGSFRIKIYSTDGEFIDSVGSYGTLPGQFVRPKGIAVDDSLNLYVVDAGFENIQIFNKEGQLLTFFGGTYKGPGDMWLPAKVIIDYKNLSYFEKYVYEGFDLQYLIFVTNQYGPDKISVYGFVEDKKGIESLQ